jgi:carboxylesterase
MQLSNEPFYFKAENADNEAFLLLHGLGGGVYEMRLLAEQLHALGYNVAGINYPGHDVPAFRMPASTWEQWYHHVETTYRELADSHPRVSVVGFSTGCMLGLHLAASLVERNPVARLVLLSPFLKVRKEWYYLLAPELYIRSVGRIVRQVPRFRLPINDPTMHAQVRGLGHYKTFNLTAVRSALDLIRIVSATLESIQSPTLIIQSHRDTVVCPSGANLLMHRLGSPVKEVCWLEESDHVVLLDSERHAVIERILAFIQATPVGGPQGEPQAFLANPTEKSGLTLPGDGA